MTSKKKFLNAAGVVVLVVALVPFALFVFPQLAGASQSYVVLSSSMSPSIHAGDVVLVDGVDSKRIESGDVITFEPPAGHEEESAERVTHRVVEVVQRDDGRYFRTRGDANEEPDRQLVPEENVVGRVAMTLPKVGHVIQFAGSDAGILLFVVAPAVLLLVTETWTLVSAVRRSPEGDEANLDGADEERVEQSVEGGD